MRTIKTLFVLMLLYGISTTMNAQRINISGKGGWINLRDTIPTKNKIENFKFRSKKFGDVYISVGKLFLDQAQIGVLSSLSKNKKNYLKSYLLKDSTLDVLIANRPYKSKGIILTFAEINKSDYENILDIPIKNDSIFYPIVSYIDEKGNLYKDSHYFIFNLKNTFNIGNKINDIRFENLKKSFENNILKVLSKYYSHNGMGNTRSILYTWTDIIDIIQKNNSDVDFQLAEIISYDKIQDIVDNDSNLQRQKPAYQDSYHGREKQLTLLGEYKNQINTALISDVYFDMGSLYP